jgi:small subunit ribosomal protein S6
MILRKYETLFVVKPELTDEAMNAIRTRLTDNVHKNGGLDIAFQDWGKKRLAYPIRKFPKGNYVYYRYLGTGVTVFELERQLKVMDDVLRFMSMVLDTRVEAESFDYDADRATIFPFGVRPRSPEEGDRREAPAAVADGPRERDSGEPEEGKEGTDDSEGDNNE